MPSSRASRASDIKLLVGATVGIVLVGLFIAGALYMMTSGGGSDQACGEQRLSASDVRKTLQDGGPYFTTGGANCGFWLALDDNDIVAYKVKQPSGCALRYKRDHWECGGQIVDAAALAKYLVSIRTENKIDILVIDFSPPTTTTRA